MKKIMVPYVICLYMIEISFFLVNIFSFMTYVFFGICILSFCLGIANILLSTLRKDNEKVYKETLIFKSILIPYYVVAFIILLVLLFIGLVSITFVLPFALIALVSLLFTYFVMVSTSVGNIVSILKSDETIVWKVVNTICQFIFIADYIDAIYLCSSNKANYKKMDSEII